MEATEIVLVAAVVLCAIGFSALTVVLLRVFDALRALRSEVENLRERTVPLIDELRTNYTIIIVTHSMQQAARVSQRTAFFHLGHLIECDDTETVFTNPEHELTQGYITGRFG